MDRAVERVGNEAVAGGRAFGPASEPGVSPEGVGKAGVAAGVKVAACPLDGFQ